ncbi:MAG: hypothetical protein KAJ44_00900 [Thermoplasmatales archaeon]|nr:hypothetical protein [Thermoplasmatales archaeon]
MSVNKERIDFLKDLKENNPDSFQKEYQKTNGELFDRYCRKRHYKDECDPHCVFAYSDKCEYLNEMNKIWDVVGYLE